MQQKPSLIYPTSWAEKRINQKCFQQFWEKFSFYFDKASSLGEKQINDLEFFLCQIEWSSFSWCSFWCCIIISLCSELFFLKYFCMSDFSVTVTVVIKRSLPFQDFVISRWLFQQPVKTTLKNVSIFIKFKSGFLYERTEFRNFATNVLYWKKDFGFVLKPISYLKTQT